MAILCLTLLQKYKTLIFNVVDLCVTPAVLELQPGGVLTENATGNWPQGPESSLSLHSITNKG